jgi:hypothetical protein
MRQKTTELNMGDELLRERIMPRILAAYFGSRIMLSVE